jgi:hypothetical protein
MRIRLTVVFVTVLAGWSASIAPALAQTPPPRPTPFPTAGSAATASAETPEPAQPPADGSLGAPVYPAAVFLASVDAGKGGQRYHLYGADASYTDIVNYYKTTLRDGGRTLFEAPAMHHFELGRFQERTMAHQPSVVVKDYTWNGSAGYLHVEGATVRRFPTIIQIVPPVGR